MGMTNGAFLISLDSTVDHAYMFRGLIVRVGHVMCMEQKVIL
jgi:hypothetical protein